MGIFHASRLVDIGFQCPCCAGTEYTTWNFPHPLIVHWVLNPGLVVNELLLGQRIPKTTYFCASCGSDSPFIRYYRCPGCGHFHEEAIWMDANGFCHWFGLICPDCGREIPSLVNLCSWIVLSKLSPINWLLQVLVGRRYVIWERRRARTARRQVQAAREQFQDRIDETDLADAEIEHSDAEVT